MVVSQIPVGTCATPGSAHTQHLYLFHVHSSWEVHFNKELSFLAKISLVIIICLNC